MTANSTVADMPWIVSSCSYTVLVVIPSNDTELPEMIDTVNVMISKQCQNRNSSNLPSNVQKKEYDGGSITSYENIHKMPKTDDIVQNGNDEEFPCDEKTSEQQFLDSQGESNYGKLLACKIRIVLPMDARLAGLVTLELNRSSAFRQNFRKYARRQGGNYQQLSALKDAETECSVIEINLLWPNKFCLDYKWNYRIVHQIKKRLTLEDAMNWLNTLGGGYSALGECFNHHAEQAGKIAIRQLRIALEMGDPPTVIRCHLYFGLSLMQRGYLRKAKLKLRCQYQEARALPILDHRLIASCKGIWSKLQYLYIRRRTEKCSPNHLNGTLNIQEKTATFEIS